MLLGLSYSISVWIRKDGESCLSIHQARLATAEYGYTPFFPSFPVIQETMQHTMVIQETMQHTNAGVDM